MSGHKGGLATHRRESLAELEHSQSEGPAGPRVQDAVTSSMIGTGMSSLLIVGGWVIGSPEGALA